MTKRVTTADLREAYDKATGRLLAEKGDSDHWTGELSASALSTATAASALWLADRRKHAERIDRALEWLAGMQNADGGWGDTTRSRSNLSTTCLALAAFTLTSRGHERLLVAARSYIDNAGGIDAVIKSYGTDRTFSAPILTNLALAGIASWEECPELPFYLAALPSGWLKDLGLRVVSYALPALIAVGLAQFANGKTRDPLAKRIKGLAAGPALRRLGTITPESGGFLEATPITSFVAMGLIAAGRAGCDVAKKNIEFLCAEQRPDGSWKIERDLAIWLTTLSVNALGRGDAATRDWLLAEQAKTVHPYVGSPPGAWGWTNASGSVPDADDTSGALLALALTPQDDRAVGAARRGVEWLLDLQNEDGGWPTFCKGWQNLPFDRSCADITAHALRALSAWRGEADRRTAHRIAKAVRRGFDYLRKSQAADGRWTPLWFGNENAPRQENSVYGTARVLTAYRDLGRPNDPSATRGVDFLRMAQNEDGSWGGAAKVEGSVEETALACDALCGLGAEARKSQENGLGWLCRQIAEDGLARPAPIGLYFAKLWYFEKLYPIVFSVSALRRALECRGNS